MKRFNSQLCVHMPVPVTAHEHRRYALIVSNTYHNGNLASDSLSPIPLPSGDANYLRMKKCAQERGFDTQVSGFNVSAKEMDALVQRFIALVYEGTGGDGNSSALCLFYFSGYGSRVNGENVLLCNDGKFWDLERDYMRLLSPGPNRPNVLMLDCVCIPGGSGGSNSNRANGFAWNAPPINFFVMFAVDERESDGTGDYTSLSPFTSAVSRALGNRRDVEQLAKAVRLSLSIEWQIDSFAVSTLTSGVMV